MAENLEKTEHKFRQSQRGRGKFPTWSWSPWCDLLYMVEQGIITSTQMDVVSCLNWQSGRSVEHAVSKTTKERTLHWQSPGACEWMESMINAKGFPPSFTEWCHAKGCQCNPDQTSWIKYLSSWLNTKSRYHRRNRQEITKLERVVDPGLDVHKKKMFKMVKDDPIPDMQAIKESVQ